MVFIGVKTSEDVLVPNPEYSAGSALTECLVSRMYKVGFCVYVAERLALPTSVHGVASSNPAGGEILPEPKRRFIAQSLSC